MRVLRTVLSIRSSLRVRLTRHITTLRRTSSHLWYTNPNRPLFQDLERLLRKPMPRLRRCSMPILARELGRPLAKVFSGNPCRAGRRRHGLFLKVSREVVLPGFSISRRPLGPFQSQPLHLHRRNPPGDLSMHLVNSGSRSARPLGRRGLLPRLRILAGTHEMQEIHETQGKFETPGKSDSLLAVSARRPVLAILATTVTPFSTPSSGRCLILGWWTLGWRPSSVIPAIFVTRGMIRATTRATIRATTRATTRVMTLESTLGIRATTLV